MTALAGEMGEAANVLKKIRRGDFTYEQAKDDFSFELADVAIYLDLLAERCGIDLEAAIIAKFNAVSENRGSTIRLV